MKHEKFFLNGKDITKYIKKFTHNKIKDIFNEFYEITLQINTKKDFDFFNYLGDEDFIENRLEYLIYSNEDVCVKAETYSFAKEDVKENNGVVDIPFCEKDKIINLLDKIDELKKEKYGIRTKYEIGLGNTYMINNILNLLNDMNYQELAILYDKLLKGGFTWKTSI